MKIFLINLPYQKDRLVNMSKQLEDRGLKYEIFPAVVGKELTEDFILQFYDKTFYDNRNHSYPMGMIGCALSHFFIYEKMVKENIPQALILEDDVVLSSDFNLDFLTKYASLASEDEMHLLFYHKFTTIELYKDQRALINGKYSNYKLNDIQGLVSTGCYFISNKIAKTMYENLLPLKTYPDEWVTFSKNKYFDQLNVVYPFIIDSALLQSSISAISSSSIIINKFLQFCQFTNFLWFNRITFYRRKFLFNKMRKVKVYG